jgi:hypothetical protein
MVRSYSLQSPQSSTLNGSTLNKHLKALSNSAQDIASIPSKATELKIYIVTWNMNGRIPNGSLESLFGPNKYRDCQLIVIGTQECEKSIEKSVLFPSRHKEWDSKLDGYFPDFVRVKTDSLVAIHMSIFVRKEFKNFVHHSFSARLATGVGNVIGNKGAVGISFQFKDHSFLFMNAHLSGIAI